MPSNSFLNYLDLFEDFIAHNSHPSEHGQETKLEKNLSQSNHPKITTRNLLREICSIFQQGKS